MASARERRDKCKRKDLKRWDTAKEAALSFGKPRYSGIYLMCNIAAGKVVRKGKLRHVLGYKWEFA